MFQCDEFLAIAQNCKSGHILNGDGALRTAVSRAYYAAYHRVWLHGRIVGKERFSNGPEAHSEVKNYLQNLNWVWSKDLEKLRRMRNRADYDLHYLGHNLNDDTQDAIDLATELFKRIPDPGTYSPYD